jgi:hypothetical protein
MEDIEVNEYVLMENCCLKKRIKDVVQKVVIKQLTDGEAFLLCIYHYMVSTAICYVIIHLNMARRFLEWTLVWLLSKNMITMAALFINCLVVIQMVENTKNLVRDLLCPCDYRSHPEIEEVD